MDTVKMTQRCSLKMKEGAMRMEPTSKQNMTIANHKLSTDARCSAVDVEPVDTSKRRGHPIIWQNIVRMHSSAGP